MSSSFFVKKKLGFPLFCAKKIHRRDAEIAEKTKREFVSNIAG
jgi:hypothetical protein